LINGQLREAFIETGDDAGDKKKMLSRNVEPIGEQSYQADYSGSNNNINNSRRYSFFMFNEFSIQAPSLAKKPC